MKCVTFVALNLSYTFMVNSIWYHLFLLSLHVKSWTKILETRQLHSNKLVYFRFFNYFSLIHYDESINVHVCYIWNRDKPNILNHGYYIFPYKDNYNILPSKSQRLTPLYWYANYAWNVVMKSKFRSRISCSSSTSLAETQILSLFYLFSYLLLSNDSWSVVNCHVLKIFRTLQFRPLLRHTF